MSVPAKLDDFRAGNGRRAAGEKPAAPGWAELREQAGSLLDADRVLAFVKDAAGRYVFANLRFREAFHPQGDVAGRCDADLFPPAQAARFRAGDLQVLEEGRPICLQQALQHRDGDHPMLVTLFPLSDSEGKVTAVGGIALDLGAKRSREARRRRREEPFQLLVSSVSDYAIFMLDTEGMIATWNAGAQRIKGYSRGEVVGRHFSVFYPVADVAAGRPARVLREAAETGRSEDEGWRIRKDGGRFWANVVINAVRDAQGRLTGFAKVTRDLTQKRAAEQALLERDARLQALIDNCPLAILSVDARGRVERSNPAFSTMFGWSTEELRARRGRGPIGADPSPEEWERLAGAMRSSHPCTEATRRRHKDGRMLEVELLSVPLPQHGGFNGAYAIYRDLTPVKAQEQLERQRREMELRVGEIERAVQLKNEFLATASHDLRTPLTAVLGFSDLLLEGVGGELNAEQRRFTEHIHSAGDYLLRLLNELLDLSKLEAGQAVLSFTTLELEPVAADVLATLRPMAETLGLGLRAEVAPGLALRADPLRLRQVLYNVLSNALKFTSAGEVVLSAAQREDAVEINIADTGVGIAPENLPRVFEEFFQADKGAAGGNQGSGLGLAITRRLVEAHGGRIAMASTLGEGTTVTLHFPAAAPAAGS